MSSVSGPTRKPSSSRDRPLTAMLRDLGNDAATLIRQEIGLARAEIRQNVKELVSNAGQLAVGGGVAAVGVLVLVAFLVVGLGALLGGEYWLSALIVALVLLGGGAALGFMGIRRISEGSLAPEETVASLKETSSWASEEVRQLRGAIADGGKAGDLVADETRAGGPLPAATTRGSATAVAAALPLATAPRRPPADAPLHRRVLREINDDDVLGQGAKVAFYMFSSLPPALLVVFALTGLFGGDEVGNFLTSRLEDALPGSGNDPSTAAGFINQFVEQVVHANAPGPLSIGLLLGIWASSAVFVALTEALNKAYDVEEDRSWFRRRAIAIGVMVAFALLFLLGSAALVAGPGIAEALQLGPVGSIAWSILQWPLAFGLIVAAFFMVYYVLPNRDQSTCKGALVRASAIAGALWLLATLGFRIYISEFGSYGVTYGIVGAVMVLLLWMYLTSVVILVGGEISSEMQREAKA